MNVRLRILLAFAMLATTSQLTAAPPPPFDALGELEYEQTGKYPPVLTLQKEENGRKVVLAGFKVDRPHFTVRPAYSKGKEERGLCLEISHRETFPLDSALYTDRIFAFELLAVEVFAIYDELYAVRLSRQEQFITLTRVTDKVPEKLRPAGGSRIISLADVNPSLFWEQHPQFRDFKEFSVVRLKIDKSTKQATLELEPRGRVSGPGLGNVRPQRKPMTLQVEKGDLLTAYGRSYKVLNVVPEQAVKDAGRLVGWIEISAEPVEAEESETPKEQ